MLPKLITTSAFLLVAAVLTLSPVQNRTASLDNGHAQRTVAAGISPADIPLCC